ncbi:MAG: transcription antitermination factor NusB [Rhodospirillales bacterium]|nr:transcription antitermination factor NusB [Rhodospirillales bacterium]
MTKQPVPGEDGGPAGAWTGEGRSAARLAAVQALYEIEMTDAPVDPVLEEFFARRWSMAHNAAAAEDATASAPVERDLAQPDKAWLRDVVRGAWRRKDEIDRMIADALAGGRTMERLEMLLKAVLRAGAYELVARLDVPPRVVISEYVDVAHAFFAGSEPAFVNGVLDGVARKARPHAFGESAHGASEA